MLTKLYLETTNPKLSWSTFFSTKIVSLIIISVIFHTILYTLFCNIVNFIFFGKLLSKKINIRLILCLIIIMFFGYIGRFIHVKQVYRDYNYNYEKTKEYLNIHYNSWIFIG
jgi:dolichyl-phosphate-mannose--protein O-mannosyl transferase